MPRSFLLYAEVESRAADPRTWQQKWEDAISVYEKNVDPRLQIGLSFVDPLWMLGGEAVGAVKATRLAKRADSVADALRAAGQVEHAEQLLNDVKALSKAGREREAKAAIENAQRAVMEKPTKILPRSIEELPAEAKKQLASFDPESAPKLTPYDTPEVIYARKLNEMPPAQKISKAERSAFRDKTAVEYYGEGAARRDKQAFIVTGLSGSGKSSTIVEKLAHRTGSKIIDMDEIRQFFPQYYGWNSGVVNSEASNILQNVVEKAIKNGDNFVYPIIGERLDALRRLRDRLLSNGYDVHVSFIHASPETAARNVVKRFKETGRFLDPKIPLEHGLTPLSNYDILVKEGGLASYAKYSNEGVKYGRSPRLLGESAPRSISDRYRRVSDYVRDEYARATGGNAGRGKALDARVPRPTGSEEKSGAVRVGGQVSTALDYLARHPQLVNALLTTKRLWDRSNKDVSPPQPSQMQQVSGRGHIYITHTPYYTMEFPVQAQSALDAYFRRGEPLPREAVTELAQVWRARSPQPPLVRGDTGGIPFRDWVNGLAPRERVYIPRMPR